MKNVIGIDIGGTNFRIGLITSENELKYFEQRSSKCLDSNNIVESLKDEIQSYIMNNSLGNTINYIAIGLPSIVSKDKSYVYSTPNLKGLNDIDLGNLLQDKLKIKVFIDRDVNFLLYHDIKKNKLDPKKEKTILGFYYGTGLGNAIYIEGKSYQGSNGAAGELGHIPMFGIEDKCGCGNIGCIETRCSGKYLQHLVDTKFPDVGISNIFKEKGSHPLIISFVKSLAIPIATEANILDPDIMILGGGVLFMENFDKELLLSEIRQRLRKPFPYKTVEFIFTEHNQQSGVIGGSSYIADTLI